MTTRELWTDLYDKRTTATAPAPKRTNARPEQAVLNAVLKVARLHPKVAWIARFNVAGFYDRTGRFVKVGFRGLPDLMGQLKDGRLLGLEVKAEDGRLTDDQRAVLETITANNGVAGCVRSIDDALAILDAS